MRTCNACGGQVTDRFARVFGTNEDEVYACPNCTTMTDIMRHGATEADGEGRDRPEPAPTDR
jgi:hypothetical protein